jgi:hypothetical protein
MSLAGRAGVARSVLIVSSCGGCGAWLINQPLALIAISLNPGSRPVRWAMPVHFIGVHRASIRLLPHTVLTHGSAPAAFTELTAHVRRPFSAGSHDDPCAGDLACFGDGVFFDSW